MIDSTQWVNTQKLIKWSNKPDKTLLIIIKETMKRIVWLMSLMILIGSCTEEHIGIYVKSNDELNDAIRNAMAGNEIILANGTWKDVQINFMAYGTPINPIILRAETPGQVFIEGASNLKFGGAHLKVVGLYFRNGYSPSGPVVSFRINQDTIANNCRLTNCVIEDYNQISRGKTDNWVEFWGKFNQMDHCYLAGKSNRGPTVRVRIEGNENIRNYHKIINNHFGPRPPKGGPSAETIQLGNSSTSMSPSNTLVANNFFERCNGEVEVISSKTNYNEFRNNVFYKCEGSLVMRHGNYCTIDGNIFIGEENNEHIGGIRIINTGHRVFNNYFYNLRGQNFRAPLAIMNGIPRSPMNRYGQVTDVVVAYNSWINCVSPWQFGVGSNIDQKDVLPASEIRSARPIRMIVANNIIYNQVGDTVPVVAYDRLEGIDFKNNIINNQGIAFEQIDGLSNHAFTMSEVNDKIFAPDDNLSDFDVYEGFDFDLISGDLFGNSRMGINKIGAIVGRKTTETDVLNTEEYGTDWYEMTSYRKESNTILVSSDSGEFREKLMHAEDGDLFELSAGDYEIDSSLIIDKHITIRGIDENKDVKIIYKGEPGTPAFELLAKGNLRLEHLSLKGTKVQHAFATGINNMSSHYHLEVNGCRISDFNYIFKAYKESMSDSISFKQTEFRNCKNGIDLSAEDDDRGDYNTEHLLINECLFENIGSNVINYYRGGYDESTIGGDLNIIKSTFVNCGRNDKSRVLLNTYGIINVNIEDCTFKNNRVKNIAILWGAKNNRHSGNTISNSGKILVEENLKLKLVY